MIMNNVGLLFLGYCKNIRIYIHIYIHLKQMKLKVNRDAKPVYIYIYKQGWKSVHKTYKACRCKCKHRQGKSRPMKTVVMKWKTSMHKVWSSDITGIHTHLQHWIPKECIMEPDNQIPLESHPGKGLRRLRSHPPPCQS